MNWNDINQTLSIDWYEEKNGSTKEGHFFEKKPFKLQLHPITKMVMRAYFHGTRPGWINRYAKEYKYGTEEVVTPQGKGWFICNWRVHLTGFLPLLSPFLRGSIEEWFEKVDINCDVDKHTLLDHLDTVEMNLTYYPSEFEKYGLHYRPEELNRIGGALVVEQKLIPIDCEGVFTYEDWPDYQHVIKSLIKVRPIPDEVEAFILSADEEEDFVLDLTDSMALEVQEEILEFEIESDEEFELVLTSEDEHILVLDEVEETQDIVEESQEVIEVESTLEDAKPLDVEVDEGEDEQLIKVSSDEESAIELEPIEEVVVIEEPSIPDSIESLEITEKVTEKEKIEQVKNEDIVTILKVSEKSVKKEGIVAGQTLLF